MDIKSKLLYVARVEDDEEETDTNKNEDTIESVDNINFEETEPGEKKEKIVFIGSVEDNENFEEEPRVERGALHTIIEASSKRKTDIYEV